ncbi:DISARM system SNF2-like helicase DrmD [Sorangium sp. So ce131]|uniref:DISARM system SNF2-like helicase DrmD n=1 Tax=Sorangium sp. So ce131 TaxID=3133282 RepID=UPI003F6118F8
MAARKSHKAPESIATFQPFVSAPDPSAPTVPSVLAVISAGRLLDLCRLLGCEVRDIASSKDRLVSRLSEHLGDRLPTLLRELGRDELRAVCRRHGLDPSARARGDLQALLLEAAGLDPRAATVRPPDARGDGLPAKGQIVHARHRQWLVDEVVAGAGDESPLVRLVCLDDDDPGRQLDVLWNLELGARVVEPETHGLGEVSRLDPPAHFGAYLHALKWSAVSAADATRFQSPFRAGIKLMAHQLTPLMKALELPRANLFIADDVGLGKTIEAGLVLQELLLRQQASFVLVVCPASVCLQWQGEMQRRFGLRFEVMTRQFVAYRRQEHGFGINAWSTHNRFIVSHALLRRPEYRDPLLHHLGERARKGLLILDEAHIAAPASASKYATDTDITRTIRDLAPRFDNRIFLSATPHNGHSNSFSALLEILDPVRFTRGVPVEGKKDLDPIMVRRLKRDLRQLGVERFPRRMLVQLALSHRGGAWRLERTSYDAETGEEGKAAASAIGEGQPIELTLGEKLQRYMELCAPESGQGRLPFIHLQQRLLSSPEAFARTLEVHAQGLAKKGGPVAAPQQQKIPFKERAAKRSTTVDVEADPETHGLSDEALAEESYVVVRRASAALPSPTEEARALLAEMRALAEKARREPDAKALAMLGWMREHLCPAIGLGPDARARRAWTPRRVILFTEYADTKRYLVELLTAAVAHTEEGENRILQFHGGMGDDARDEVQRAFNSAPDEHPVRVLVATDAAREGVNLQAHCADLFHIDIPWNPARMEQRNGRIDRTLQPAEEVRCHYFVYPQRREDQVLDTVVRKIATVQRELGSLGAVLLGQIEAALANGITRKVHAAVEKVGSDAKTATVDAELEARRTDLEAVRAEVLRAGRRLESSRRTLEVEPESLRGVVEIGLGFGAKDAGGDPKRRASSPVASAPLLKEAGKTSDGRATYELPPLDRSWDVTLDTLRPPRGRTEDFWEWRQRPPRPVTFHPLASLSEGAEQLHLAHPFVKRILDRFLAQGFGAHDLTRVSAVVAPGESVVRVVGFARLTLFGIGAARLHDQLVPVAAAWSGDASEVKPYKDRATAASAISSTERLLAGSGRAPNATISKRIQQNAEALFRALWPHLEAEADALAVEARQGLAERARREADDLRGLLARQRVAIDKAEARLRQADLFNLQDKEQKRQVDLDLKHLERRRAAAASELESEPAAIEALYDVRMARLTPVGLVVAWPESMT